MVILQQIQRVPLEHISSLNSERKDVPFDYEYTELTLFFRD
jgi:hypothetical protein